MFKSRIPLQTPIVIKLLLFVALVAFFAGWSLASDASSKEPQSQLKVVLAA